MKTLGIPAPRYSFMICCVVWNQFEETSIDILKKLHATAEKYEIMRKFLDTHDERSLLKSIINRELPFPVNMLPVDDTKKLELQSELMSSKDINVFLDMLPRKRGCAPHISNLRDQLIRLKGKNSLWRDVRNVFRRSIQFS